MTRDGAAALDFGLRCLELDSPPGSRGRIAGSRTVLLRDVSDPEEIEHPLLVAARPEDCARLLCIAHAAGQRFGVPIHLVLPAEILALPLRTEVEHIPLPPAFVLRGGESVDDQVREDHPALSFHRLSHGVGRGPRNRSRLLIVSHGAASRAVEEEVSRARRDGIRLRHLSLQTLNPLPSGALQAAMDGSDESVVLDSTRAWIAAETIEHAIGLQELAARLRG